MNDKVKLASGTVKVVVRPSRQVEDAKEHLRKCNGTVCGPEVYHPLTKRFMYFTPVPCPICDWMREILANARLDRPEGAKETP